MSPAIDRANSSAAVRIEKLIAAADGYAKHMAASKTEWGGATRYRVELLPVKSGKWLQRRRTCTTPMEAKRSWSGLQPNSRSSSSEPRPSTRSGLGS